MTRRDSIAGRATFDNWRLAVERGFNPIIARAEFQDRGSKHENALEFHPSKLEVEQGLHESELAVLLKGVAR